MKKSIFEIIISFLDSRKIQYTVLEHKRAHSSEEEARITGIKLSQAAKTLIMFGDKKPLMVVLSAVHKVDFKRFKSLTKIKNLEIATAEQVREITGAEIGTVPPFGNLFNLPLYVDNHLKEEEEIVFGTGLYTKSIRMKYRDFEKVTNPIIGDFIQNP